MNTRKIEKLKKEARKHIIEYRNIASNYNCGLSLMEYISPDMLYHKIEFNKIMDKLAELDPLTPDFRL